MSKKITAGLILIILFVMFVSHTDNLTKAIDAFKNTEQTETGIINFSSTYKDGLAQNGPWVNLYGLILKTINKREIKNFRIVCDKEGNMYMQTARLDDYKVRRIVADIKAIQDTAADEGADFLFVQTPYKNYSRCMELRGYGQDYTEDNFDRIVAGLKADAVPILDLRAMRNWSFFRTDHHWTVESSFYASSYIMETINELYDGQLNVAFYSDIDNYKVESYPNSLLGSTGIQVGEYYSGKDDFDILIPAFDTNLEYEHFVNGKKKSSHAGEFKKTFIEASLLKKKDYYNKYNALLHMGWNENIIRNLNADNEKKCLFVSHSYGRSLVQYLSLYFAETRYLDPQIGRYNDNYLEYIQNYHPDIVIVMYDEEINVGG